MSEKLHALCCNPNTPVCMIRGLCPIVNLDLELFSSKSIVKSCPDHEMEVREQVSMAALQLALVVGDQWSDRARLLGQRSVV